MATTNPPNAVPDKVAEGAPTAPEGQSPPQEDGFFALLIRSVFEPGANSAVVTAMNISFFLLLVTLFGLAFLSNWNIHVLALIGINACLWAAMVWFVMQITKVRANRENLPPGQFVPEGNTDETRKDR